jgi:hypothetical protein
MHEKKMLKIAKLTHQPIENKGRASKNEPKTKPNEPNKTGVRD